MKKLMMAVICTAALSSAGWSLDMESAKMQSLSQVLAQALQKQNRIPACGGGLFVDSQGICCNNDNPLDEYVLVPLKDLQGTPFVAVKAKDGLSRLVFRPAESGGEGGAADLQREGALVSGDELKAAYDAAVDAVGQQRQAERR